MDIEKVKRDIRALIEKYYNYRKKWGERSLKNLHEANVRKDFIDPLFEALGWKVRDSQEYDAEKYVRGAGFVDISLCIRDPSKLDKRIPKIFVEAKRFGNIPSVRERGKQRDLHGNLIAGDWTKEERQVLNYAASQKIKWAVLTNFEKFRVFNALNGLTIINIEKPEEYLERIEELIYLSKEYVETGKIDDLERREERPDIDENFLNLMRTWRIKLARNIFKNNPDLSLDEIKEATQRILDRLIIVRFAEDKLILDSPDLIRDTYEYWLKHKSFGSLFDMLFGENMVFSKFNEQYNGKIFERGHICEKVKIDDEVLGEIIDGLYTVNFRKFTSDILGNTYESYLGETLDIEDGELVAKPSMETRKEFGIYYTPSYVVKFIVDNTVRAKIEPIWKEVEALLDGGEYKKAEETFKKISEIKVLDPAMGSGSFLIRAFNIFKEYYEKYNTKIEEIREEIKKKGNNNLDIFYSLPRKIRDYEKKILKENIYGVDLDSQASEIGAVNLMLQALRKGEKLPLILEENIKTGNSLISGILNKEDLEPYREDIKKLILLRKKLKETDNEKEKKEIQKEEKEIRERINRELNEKLLKKDEKDKEGYFDNLDSIKPFNWEIEFPEVFFNEDGSWKEDGGFDCIIGNPPYGADYSEQERQFIEKKYSNSKGNSAEFFLELGIKLLKRNGKLGMIVPKSIAFYKEWSRILEYLLKNCNIDSIFDVGLAFKDVNYEEIVIIFQKRPIILSQNSVKIYAAFPLRKVVSKKKKIFLGTVNEDLMRKEMKLIFRPINTQEEKILNKLINNNLQFKEIYNNVFRGLYIPDSEKKKLKEGDYLFVEKVPHVARYEIKQVRKIDISGNPKWLKKASKVLVPRIFFKVLRGNRLVCNYDYGDLLTTEKLVNVTLKNEVCYSLPFLTGVFNSIVPSYYIQKMVFSGTTETSRVMDEHYIKNLPVPSIYFVTPHHIRKELFEKGKKNFLKCLEMDDLSDFMAFVDERLQEIYDPDEEFVRYHNEIFEHRKIEINKTNQSDVVHDLVSYFVDQLVLLKKQRRELLELFIKMLKKFRQIEFFRPLKEYVDLKTVRELRKNKKLNNFVYGEKKETGYSINLLDVEELVDYKKEGRVVQVDIRESDNYLILSVKTEDDFEGDIIKIPVMDNKIRRFMLLAIKLHLEKNQKKVYWSKNRILEVLENIKIPKSVPNEEKDSQNIRELMEAFESKLKEILDEKFKDSFVKSSDISEIDRKIRLLDKTIEESIYKLYGLTDEEIEIVKESLGTSSLK